ncbi:MULTISPECIES: SseB family protein [unclassified Microbacterium]|uniref:SseB family protein n=1 Tax=unclassified Microbacterium TaxID=2609290 RepID=UPI003015AB1B
MNTTPIVDRAITRAREGRLTMQSVLWTFAAGTVYVPSGADPGPDRGGMRPVYYEVEATRMLAVFTSPDAAEVISDLAPFIVALSGEDLLTTMPSTEGIVVNPGSGSGFDVPPEGLAAFRQELSG